MAKDIQIKYINELSEWEELFPVTKSRLVQDETGQNLTTLLNAKANKNEVYTSLEIDSKLSDINDTLSNVKHFDIPVQSVEPDDESTLWFEIV